jgi:nucleoside-diphosphate-sugar epimerase
MVVLHSIPVSQNTEMMLDVLRSFHPNRIVYLSTTGVYGAAELVDEHTIAAPETEQNLERLQTEELILSGPWSSLVLRPAAIYGPHRGVHTSARSGVFGPPPGGNRIISRIHVDDLADQVLAGLRSDITGAFPVADEEPSTSLEVAEWTAACLGIPLRFSESATAEPKGGRRVEGSAYRSAVGLLLRYPSFRQGVPACLREEDRLGLVLAQ